MSEIESAQPTHPLRLRWTSAPLREHSTRLVWTAFDGPWRIGMVRDDRQMVPDGTKPYSWFVGILSMVEFGAGLIGTASSSRAAAEDLERTFFHCLPDATCFVDSLEGQIAYAEWLGIPLPASTLQLKSRHIDGENPFPITPLRSHLERWAIEDRKRGGRGMVTPAMMAKAFGADWRDQIKS